LKVHHERTLSNIRFKSKLRRCSAVWSWKQYYDDTMTAAKGFIALGLGRFESVNILGFNAPQW